MATRAEAADVTLGIHILDSIGDKGPATVALLTLGGLNQNGDTGLGIGEAESA